MEPPPPMEPPAQSHHLYVHPPPSSSVAGAPSGANIPYTPLSPYQPPISTPYPSYHPPIHSTTCFPPSYPSSVSSTAFYPPPTASNVGFPQPHTFINPPISHPTYHFSATSPTPIDVYMRRVRDEVIFLHDLWHQGPPRSTFNPDSDLTSIADPVQNLHFHLKPSHSTSFKKKKKKPWPKPVTDDNPWLVPLDPPAPPLSESGWPEFPPCPMPHPPVVTDEYKARVSAIRVQQKASDSFRRLISGNHGSKSDSESDGDDDRARFDHFLDVFEGYEELKGYYKKNWGNGEFVCLVCGGSGQMVGRKYKNCVALVQHTITISKTKKRAAHRDYGQVVCKVLGWSIDQLPLLSRDLSLQQQILQGNDMNSAEAFQGDPVCVESITASLANDNNQSDPSKSTSVVGEGSAVEKMEAFDLPLVLLDNPGDQQNENPCMQSISHKPWPAPLYPSALPEPESGWQEFPPRPTPLASVSGEEESSSVLTFRVHQKGLDFFRSFFAEKHHDQDDSSDGCANCDKFLEVFDGDEELRGYYQKNWQNGEFLCFVCDGTSHKVGRKYKNCVALVQHTIMISKTKKRAAHRAYGEVICKVLGWNIDQLPLIVRNLQQGNGMSSAEACKDEYVGVETNSVSLVDRSEQSDLSKATLDVGDVDAAKKMKTSDLP